MQSVESAIEPEVLKRDRRAPQRSCIVTRESQDKDRLIRFVTAPDGTITPDIAHKLPGRGYWVSCSKEILEQAIREKQFVKASKGQAVVSDDLPAQVERLLSERALQFLGLAAKAGALITGFEKVADPLGKGRVIALLHALEASPESVRKLPISDEKRFCCFPEAALSARLKAEHVVHLALLDEPAGQAALKEIQRFTGFLQSKAL